MKNFIDYHAGNATNSDLASRLEEMVKEAIEKNRWRKEYMTLQEMMKDEFEEGKQKHLIGQIIKKMSKGKDMETIADEVEEEIALVQVICNVANGFAPDYDVDAIYNALKSEEKLHV